MGNPMPAQGRTDPGIRNQIFTSTYQNSDGYYALNVDFITANGLKPDYGLFISGHHSESHSCPPSEEIFIYILLYIFIILLLFYPDRGDKITAPL